MRDRTHILPAFALSLAALAAMTAFAAGSRPVLDPTEFMPVVEEDGDRIVNRQIPGNQSSAHVAAAFVPRPAPLSVTDAGSEVGTRFSGLNFRNQRVDSDHGNQLSLEPPDQALCAGNGIVVEAVNDTLAVYDGASGTRSSGFTSLNQFFIGDHQIDRTASPTVFGTFLSDPKCIYDPGANRFFMTILTIDRSPSTGALRAPLTFRLATSKTAAPTASPADWYFTTVDVTNDGSNGTPTHPGCPCLGDQPLLGSDANGVYVTTNEFSLDRPVFNGAQIYALQKSALVNGQAPTIQRIEGAPITPNYDEGIPYSLQPASSPSTADYEPANNGTEYLLGALEFGKRPFALDNRIAIWALTNTASLNSTPAIAVATKVIRSQVYGAPGNIVQKKGVTPLADSLKEHENLIDGGDDRMQAAVFANGYLWGAGDTTLKTPTGSSQVGITYYVLLPSANGSAVDGTMVNQGYVSVDGNSVTRPSLAVTASGKAVIGGTLVGPNYYPSAAYVMFDATTSPTTLRVASLGLKPADGFSGYYSFGGAGVERWGDYGAAAADGDSVWVANEWIQGNVTGLLANWNTFVTQVTP